MKLSIRGLGFLLLMSSIVLIAMAAQPDVSITAPAYNGTVINGTFEFVARITNPSENLNIIEFTITNTSGTVGHNTVSYNQPTSNSGDEFSYSLDTTTLADGDYLLAVTATNENITSSNSSSKIRTFSIDNTKPVINSVNLDNGNPNTGDSIQVTVDVTDNIGVTSVQADGTPLGTVDGIWTGTIIAVEGTHSVDVTAQDAAGNVASNNSATYTATTPPLPPSSYVPPAPAGLAVMQGNFWIKYTWGPGIGNRTDGYNVSVNGVWANTTNTYNNTTVGAHGWSNITVWAYNNSGGGSLNSTSISNEIQVENNKPVLDPIGSQTVTVGNVLTFTIHATDTDLDAINYSTNATGTLNISTGEYTWKPNSTSDVGTHVWLFTASDTYGGVSSQTVTVTVNNVPLTITSSSPVSDPTTIVGASQTFEINLNRNANVVWYVNGSAVKTNPSTISSSYTNSTAVISVYNVTSIASDGYDSVSRTWIWTVNPEPRYDVSGYVFDNYGSALENVLVKNGSYTNTTSASGYYFIPGLLNGTYTFSFSKTGFNTGYLTIIISGTDVTNKNITIFDNTPPASVSSPNTYAAVGSFFINNSWTNPADPDFSYVWFRYINGTTLQNVTKPTNSLNLEWPPHYIQNISVQTVDNYGNINQAKVWFNATVPNNLISISGIQDSYSLAEGQTLNIDAGYQDADSDTGTFSDNSDKWDVNPSTGMVSWKTKKHDEGIYNWYIKVSDGRGSEAIKSFTVSIANSTPAVPVNLINSTGNFWVRYDWNAGVNTDSFNVSYNGTWYNGSATSINRTVGPHGWGNITVYGWNNTLEILGNGVSQNTQVPNNLVMLGNISSSYTIFENNPISIYPIANDLDQDPLIFTSNTSKGIFYTNNGTFLWTPNSSESGVYNWYISVSDGHGKTNTAYFTVTVIDSTPTVPVNLKNTTGNFWVNHTWEKGANTDSFKVVQNGTIYNNKIDEYFNVSVGPHGWSNITVNGVNTSSGQVSAGVTQNTQVPNNPVTLGNISSNYTVFENTSVSIYPVASDLDNDILLFGSNITKGTFYSNNGTFLWTTGPVDNDTIYNWYINVSDGYGSIITLNFTLTVIDTTPGIPENLTNSTGNFWVNHSWQKGKNTDSFNILQNGTWYNGTTDLYFNATVRPHGWSNISVYGYNSTAGQMSTKASQNTRVPNSLIQLINVSDNYSVAEGQILTIFVNATDPDGDTGTFDKDFNYSSYDLIYNSSYRECIEYTSLPGGGTICSDWITGVPWMNNKNILIWKTLEGYDGNKPNFTYYWKISASDGWGSISIKNVSITVHDSTPRTPTNLSSTTGNFWVNHTWNGINANTFNISGVIGLVDGNSTLFIENGYSGTSINKTVGPHGWSNITVQGWNNSLKVMSPQSKLFSKQVPNNLPSVPAKTYPMNWPNLSNRTVTLSWSQSSDADGDYIDYQWQLSNKSDFTTILKSNTTENLQSEALNLTPGIYYWRVKAKDFIRGPFSSKFYWGESAWNQSVAPDFQIVAAPVITNIKAYILNDTAVKIEWFTDQRDPFNKVEYGISPHLMEGSSSWNNNTNNPGFVIGGVTGKSIFYQVSSYNNSNMTAYSNSSIFNAYPLQFSIKFIEPGIKDNNLTWTTEAKWGHVGKYIGVDGMFRNMGPDPLNISITETYNNESIEYLTNKIGNKSILLKPNENLAYNQLFGRPKFEINSSGVKDNFFTFNLKLNVTVQKGDTSYTFYNNNTVISLPLYPISKIIKSVADKNGQEIGLVLVKEDPYISPIHYTLEANSSVNMSKVSISYPDQGYFNISTLEANMPMNKTYIYNATTSDLNKYKCEGGYPCIINNVTFSGKIDSGTFPVNFTDTEYNILPLCSDIVNCIPPEEARPKVTGSSDSSNTNNNNNNNPGGGGGGGGGGVASGEDFNNIERREAREKDVNANAAAVYVFKSADPVMVVAFESTVSENGVPVLVEVLRNRSKFVDVDLPGKNYKYFNVYAGMSGFSTKIKNGVVAYRVNNTWLEENGVNDRDIALYKWEGSWVEKNTELAERKENYTYYASAVGNFTKFAIGVKGSGASLASRPEPDNSNDSIIYEMLNTTRDLASSDSTEQPFEPLKLPAPGFIFVLGVIFIVYYIKRFGNK